MDKKQIAFEKAVLDAHRNLSDGAGLSFVNIFKAGYDYAIIQSLKWLYENKNNPLIGCEDPCLSGYLTNEFIEQFKQAMGG